MPVASLRVTPRSITSVTCTVKRSCFVVAIDNNTFCLNYYILYLHYMFSLCMSVTDNSSNLCCPASSEGGCPTKRGADGALTHTTVVGWEGTPGVCGHN